MDVFTLILAGACGLAFGSFGNVLVYRIHARKPITGRSMCPSCKRTLAWFELFPVLSYAVLGGKCRRCRHSISLQYPLVELGSAALFVFAFTLHPDDPVTGIITAFVLYFLFLACVFDAKYQQIPDVFTILIGIFGVAALAFHADVMNAFLGAVVMLVWFGGQCA
jgi:prepilin signal peptidase PulO-like enzyme (type II secretory pathway)